jgi:hypothetical protein
MLKVSFAYDTAGNQSIIFRYSGMVLKFISYKQTKISPNKKVGREFRVRRWKKSPISLSIIHSYSASAHELHIFRSRVKFISIKKDELMEIFKAHKRYMDNIGLNLNDKNQLKNAIPD